MEKITKTDALVQAAPELVFSPPAIDLLYPGQDDYFWPDTVRNNLELKKQTEKRLHLSKQLDYLFSLFANCDKEFFLKGRSDLAESKAEQKKIAAVYHELTDFIESEANNCRLIIYLPFELIPDQTLSNLAPELQDACKRFMAVYLEKWLSLLASHDLRVDFVDGDILEPELRTEPLPLVSKAAHLAPVLITKGLITTEQIADLAENSADMVLKDSLREALITASKQEADVRKFGTQLARLTNQQTLSDWLKQADEEIRLLGSSSAFPEFLQARALWEKDRDQEKAIDYYSQRIAESLFSGSLSLSDWQALCLFSNTESAQLLGVSSLNKFLHKLALNDLSQAQDIAARLQTKLFEMQASGSIALKKQIEKMCFHCAHLAIVNQAFLASLAITIPNLGELFSFNPKEFTEEAEILSAAQARLKKDPELSRYFYPLFLLYGSRVKGYGSKYADIDLAIFVRPDVDASSRDKVRDLSQKLFAGDKRVGSILEFWLSRNGSGLRIKDYPFSSYTTPDKSVANSYFSHVLFGSVWFGSKELIKYFYEEIMVRYLYPQNNLDANASDHLIWLREKERDILRYRLMHKGYSRVRPSVQDDTDSFWDSGYRQIAAKLFITKVFLPQLNVL
jgi:hypothetical protein